MAYEKQYGYGYRNRKAIVTLLLLISLAFATYVVAQTYPPVNEVSVSETETGISEEGPPAIVATNVSANESEIPAWWYWSEEDWEKFKEYANETEVEWVYNETTGEKIGGIVTVAGELLYNVSTTMSDLTYEEIAPGYKDGPSPVWYLEEGERKGNCAIVPRICHMLFEVKGEKVREAGARNIDYNPDPHYVGDGHGWVEWTDSEGNQWVIDYNTVWPRDKWFQTYNWTIGYREVPLAY